MKLGIWLCDSLLKQKQYRSCGMTYDEVYLLFRCGYSGHMFNIFTDRRNVFTDSWSISSSAAGLSLKSTEDKFVQSCRNLTSSALLMMLLRSDRICNDMSVGIPRRLSMLLLSSFRTYHQQVALINIKIRGLF